jgi:hypothetical protein
MIAKYPEKSTYTKNNSCTLQTHLLRFTPLLVIQIEIEKKEC